MLYIVELNVFEIILQSGTLISKRIKLINYIFLDASKVFSNNCTTTFETQVVSFI